MFGVDRSRHLLEKLLEQGRFGEGNDGVFFHAEQRGGGAEGILGVDHHNAPVAELGFLRLQRRDVHGFGEGFVRDFQVGLQVSRVFEKMLGGPDRIEAAIPSGRLGHRPPGHGNGCPSDPAAACFPALVLEEFLADRARGGASRIDRSRSNRAHQANDVGALVRQLQEGRQIGRVVDVVGIGVQPIDFEPTDFVEADGGSVDRVAAQGCHQTFASGEHRYFLGTLRFRIVV